MEEIVSDNKMQLMKSLYGQYYRKLYLYAFTFLEDSDEAYDIVSDFFSGLWNQWQGKTEVQSPPPSFLYTSVRNACINKLRRDKVKNTYAMLAARREALDNGDEVEAYEKKISRLMEAIDQLPEPRRTILINCHFHKLTYQQTADAMGISLSSVKKHLIRAYKTLREALKNNKDLIG